MPYRVCYHPQKTQPFSDSANFSIEIQDSKAREMVQKLRALSGFVDALNSVSSSDIW